MHWKGIINDIYDIYIIWYIYIILLPFILVGWLGRGWMRFESCETLWALMPILAQGPTFWFSPPSHPDLLCGVMGEGLRRALTLYHWFLYHVGVYVFRLSAVWPNMCSDWRQSNHSTDVWGCDPPSVLDPLLFYNNVGFTPMSLLIGLVSLPCLCYRTGIALTCENCSHRGKRMRQKGFTLSIYIYIIYIYIYYGIPSIIVIMEFFEEFAPWKPWPMAFSMMETYRNLLNMGIFHIVTSARG